MTFAEHKEDKQRGKGQTATEMTDLAKPAPASNKDNFYEHSSKTKKKHANPFSVEYILSCDSSKKTLGPRNVPPAESNLSREALEYSTFVNKNFTALPYSQPPVSTGTTDVETIGE